MVTKKFSKSKGKKFSKILRPFKCTIACCGRQEMQLQWVEKGQQEYIGKISDPWDCMNYSVKNLFN